MDVWHILKLEEIKIAKLLGFPLDDKDPEQFIMPIKERDGQKVFRDTQGWHVSREKEFQSQPPSSYSHTKEASFPVITTFLLPESKTGFTVIRRVRLLMERRSQIGYVP